MEFKTRQELIRAYIDFFKSKAHKEVPSASLIPQNDPTVLFTTAGMHPLVPYLLGAKHPLGKRLVDVQKCIRTGDIEEVGDEVHHTFFEMLGNWSFGDYFKKEAIEFSFEFLTKVLKIPVERLGVSVFEGDKDAPKDEEAAKVWLSLGITKERIAFLPKKDNWWGPAGETGPCGPDSEMFYWKNNKEKAPKKFNPEDKNWVEIWNDVFMQYNKKGIKAILADAINCLIDKEGKINEELAIILKNSNKKIIVVTNANQEEIKSKLKEHNFDIFTLNKNPDKSNPIYFKELLKKHNLQPEDVIYFDHKKENIESAKKTGILSELYETINQVKKFIENNKGKYELSKQKNVDTGMGVERTFAVLNGLEDNYQTSIFKPIIAEIEKISKKPYKNEQKSMRIIADHLRAATFILADGVKPSNLGQGYVLRRLIRRAVRYGKHLGIENKFASKIAEAVIPIYPDYPELKKNKKEIIENLEEEETKFSETLEKGMREFEKMSESSDKITGKDAFLLFQSYGFPIEMTQELANEKNIKINIKEYDEEFKKHQELSRTASAGQFKSGLADDSEKTRKLHTATHLLNEALKVVLKDRNIKQKGSNINPERLRFDFNFPRKLEANELKAIEDWINDKIKRALKVTRKEMPLKEALASGAESEFGAKYPEIVSVYTVESEDKKPVSREFCTGPHVENTSELVKFKIIKEEAVAAGIRRIKATVG